TATRTAGPPSFAWSWTSCIAGSAEAEPMNDARWGARSASPSAPGRVIAIVGATASGKTSLAESLAASLNADVVCAGSRQVFRELEIGTGRPTPEARAAGPHHLFAVLHLGQHASAGWYARAACEVGEAILARGRTPLLVGGSGLYLRALRDGLAGTPP